MVKRNPVIKFLVLLRSEEFISFQVKSRMVITMVQFNAFKIDISEIDKISTLEKATNDKNYPEKDLFELYKRFQFNINQLLNTKESYKSLSSIEGKALVYQRLLLAEEPKLKLELMKILKDIFKSEGIEDAFDVELRKSLKQIEEIDLSLIHI